MDDRNVMLITGASRGIGAATAVLAAERGFDVVINYRTRADAADEVASRCRAAGARAATVQADVADEEAVVSMFEVGETELGPIRSVVNNAGILHRATRFDEITLERFRETIDVNLIGAFLVLREAMRRLSTRHGGPGGTIVNVGSVASCTGGPNEYVDYAATKGALDTMTIGTAKETATEGVRINGVRPGLIYTDIHESSGIENRVDRLASRLPMQRGGTPTEVAEAIIWLASPASSFVTGKFIDIAGGL